jgi:serine/threonine protein kinase/tetratricopeptide (TPR) repeat protein
VTKCPHCQTDNPPDSSFCKKCFAPLPQEDETLAVTPDAFGVSLPGPSVGSVIKGRYKLLEKLGSGGMGVVYKAKDLRLQRTVALKFLPSQLTADSEHKQRFIQEAHAASILDHTNICTIYEIDETEEGQMYIAMTYYEGETLKMSIRRGPMSLLDAIDIVSQVVHGLSKAHSKGIVHRDIKPANVMVTPDGVAKILDFGLAKLAGKGKVTDTQGVIGTASYMSPEQAEGKIVDHRTDLWSLGVVFYEILTGRVPFTGENIQAILYAIVHTSPIPVFELVRDIPEEAERILDKCMQKSPEKRYQTAGRLLSDLNSLRHSLSEEKKLLIEEEKPRLRKEMERRLATILSAELSGYYELQEATGPEGAALTLNRWYAKAKSTLNKYDARVDILSEGAFRAYFGVPTAVEDAPKRAANAAIELRNSLYELNKRESLIPPLNIHIGIETGTVIVGSIGEDHGLSVVGEAVNSASQLMHQTEKGQIYVGSETYRNIKNIFGFQILKSSTLPGVKKSSPVYQLLSVKEQVYRIRLGSERMIFSEMVGREKEMNVLKLHVLKVINGEGSIINVIGEAGIGKSRLISELILMEEIQKVKFLMGRALSIGENLSFHPITDFLKNWAEIKEEDISITTTKKLERAIQKVNPDGMPEAFPFIGTMMGVELTGSYAERIKGIEGNVLESLILKNLRELIIQIAAAEPVVLVMEDLHWADLTSIEFLESLLRLAESHSILFINVFRPNYRKTSERLRRRIREKYEGLYHEIYLSPLDKTQSVTLLSNLLNVRDVPSGFRQIFTKRAEGNPLFIEEGVRSLIDDGAILVRRSGFKALKSLETVTIPDTIHELLMTRIDRFDEETRSLLKVASVIGRSFFYKILAKVASDIKDLDGLLEQMKEVQILKEQHRMGEVEYRFQHALVQEVAYNSILLTKRKHLHAKVAQAIESVFSRKLHEFYGMLAYHYSVGEDLEKAEDYLVKAGEKALRAAASTEALFYYQEALELYQKKHGDLGDPEIIAHLEYNIAKAFLNKGLMADSVIHFDRALEIWGEKRPKNRITARFHLVINLMKSILSLYLLPGGGNQSPGEKLNNVLEATHQRGTALAVIDTLRMVTDSLRQLSIIHRYDLTKVRNGVPIYASASALFFFSGISFAIARKVLDNARSYLPQCDQKTCFMFGLWELACDLLSGNWGKESKFDLKLIKQTINAGEMFTAADYAFFYGIKVLEKGDFKEVEKVMSGLREIEETYESDFARMMQYRLETNFFWKKRLFVEELAEFDKKISFVIEIKNKLSALMIIGAKANMQILIDDMPGAEETIKQGEQILTEEKYIVPFYGSNYRLSRLFFYTVKLEKDLKAGSSSRTIRKQYGIKKIKKEALKNVAKNATNRVEVFKLLGVYYWLVGRHRKALHWWDKSIRAGMQLGARPELARTYMEVGKRLSAKEIRFNELNGVAAEEYIQKAELLFEEMGLQWDLGELEKIRSGREL